MLAVLDRLDSHNHQAVHRVELIESCAKAIDVIAKPSKCVAAARMINTLAALRTGASRITPRRVVLISVSPGLLRPTSVVCYFPAYECAFHLL